MKQTTIYVMQTKDTCFQILKSIYIVTNENKIAVKNPFP